MPAPDTVDHASELDDEVLSKSSLSPLQQAALGALAVLAPSCVSAQRFAEAEERSCERIEELQAQNDRQLEEIRALREQVQSEFAARVDAAIESAVPNLLRTVEETRDIPFLEEQLSRLLPGALHRMEPEMIASLLDAIDRRRETDSDLAAG